MSIETYNGQRYTNDGVWVSAKLGINQVASEDKTSPAAASGGGIDALNKDDLRSHGIGPGMIGTRRKLGPREFVLCRSANDIAITAGKIVSQAWDENSINIDGPSAADVPIGATSFNITHASELDKVTVANQLAGGYMTVYNGDGAGYTYRIKANTVMASDVVRITLYDPLVEILDASDSDILIYKNPYDDMQLTDADATTAVDMHPIGVAQGDVAVSDGQYYFWAQTKGPCSCFADAVALIPGGALVVSDTVDGACSALTDTAAQQEAAIGTCLEYTGTVSEFGPIWLNLGT